jgi:hypothetical protein
MKKQILTTILVWMLIFSLVGPNSIPISATHHLPRVDVVFLFQSTHSMTNEVNWMRHPVTYIMHALNVTWGTASMGFGLASFTDYPDYYNSYGYDEYYGNPASDDYPFYMDVPITQVRGSITTAISSMEIGLGADVPADYSRAIYETLDFNWRDGARIVVLFGDAPAHSAPSGQTLMKPWAPAEELFSSYSYTDGYGGDPGRDEIMFTADDLDYADVIQQAVESDIKFITVDCQMYSNFPDEIDAHNNLEYISYMTGGTRIIFDVDTVIEDIIEAVKEIAIYNNIVVSPLDYNFGDVELGTSETTIVTISNTGSVDLTLTNMSLWEENMPDPPDFSIEPMKYPMAIPPRGDIDVRITYSPSTAGSRSVYLEIASNDPDEPLVVVCFSGNGYIQLPEFNLLDAAVTPIKRGVSQFTATIQNDGAPAGPGLVPIGWEEIVYDIPLENGIGILVESEIGNLGFDLNGNGDTLDTFDVVRYQDETRQWDAIVDGVHAYSIFEGPEDNPGSIRRYDLYGESKLFRLGTETHYLYTANNEFARFGLGNAFVQDHPSANFELVLDHRILATEFKINGVPVEVNQMVTVDEGTADNLKTETVYIVPNQPLELSTGEEITLSCTLLATEAIDSIVGVILNWSPDGKTRYIWVPFYEEVSFESKAKFAKYYLESPGELRIIDSQGRVTGVVDGEIKEEIPYSFYVDDHILVINPENIVKCEVFGLTEGRYGLSAKFTDEDSIVDFNAKEIPITSETIHQYSIDWNSLSMGEDGVILQIDADGDGEFEQNLDADNELTHDEFILQTETEIDFDPDTLNLKHKGKYVTVYIELPSGYDITQIDASTILLNRVVPTELHPTELGDYDFDGIPDLMVKFDRSLVGEILEVGDVVLSSYIVQRLKLPLVGYHHMLVLPLHKG